MLHHLVVGIVCQGMLIEEEARVVARVDRRAGALERVTLGDQRIEHVEEFLPEAVHPAAEGRVARLALGGLGEDERVALDEHRLDVAAALVEHLQMRLVEEIVEIHQCLFIFRFSIEVVEKRLVEGRCELFERRRRVEQHADGVRVEFDAAVSVCDVVQGRVFRDRLPVFRQADELLADPDQALARADDRQAAALAAAGDDEAAGLELGLQQLGVVLRNLFIPGGAIGLFILGRLGPGEFLRLLAQA